MENERPRCLKDCLIKWEDEEERTEYLEKHWNINRFLQCFQLFFYDP